VGIKQLLGLEACSLTEEEIVERLQEARRQQLHEVEFLTTQKKVKVRLKQVNPAGIMRDYWHSPEAK